MQRSTRRTFLKSGCLGGAALALAPRARALGANDDVRVAVVGFGGQGGLHIRLLRELPGVRVVALCDADRALLERGLKQAKDLGQRVDGYLDVRKLLEDKNIDAVTTATPDHWHALVTIWACQAGKDAYVEKPLCHNLWEGRKMVEAARKYERIVQFGNQGHGHHTGQMRLEMDKLGKILVAHTSLNRMRQSIGGRFLFDDNGETPNTQLALFQYDPGPMVIFELRNLPSEKGPKTLRTKVMCEKGESGLPSPTGTYRDTGEYGGHKGHLYNFISAVRSRKVDDLRADVLEGHLSTALVHMANVSYRLGTLHSADEVRDAIKDRGSEAVDSFGRVQEHLAANGVDFSKTEVVLGPWLEMDTQSERFIGDSELVPRANELARGTYRKPFVIPEKV